MSQNRTNDGHSAATSQDVSGNPPRNAISPGSIDGRGRVVTDSGSAPSRGIVHLIKESERAERAQAWREYVALIGENSDDPKKANRVRELMAKLGRSIDDLRGDQNDVQEIARLLSVKKDGEGIDGQRTKSQEAVRNYRAESERILKERMEGIVPLKAAADALESRYAGGQNAVHMLSVIRRRHPELAKAAGLAE